MFSVQVLFHKVNCEIWYLIRRQYFRELHSHHQLSKNYGAGHRKFRGGQAPSTPQAAGHHHMHFGPTPVPSAMFYALIIQVLVIFKSE